MFLQRLALLGASAFILSGCASILNDNDQAINVNTSTGKSISGTVNGQPFNAPGIVYVARENKNKVFATNEPGCAKETVADKSVDGVFFVNILSGGPLGSTTDYGTERMWKYADTVTISCQ